jgi:GTP-binding protein YchF
MRLGIIGLPNSGKTTIFNALARTNRPTAPVSSGKIEVFTAVVNVPDERLDRLVAMYKPKKTVHTTMTYTDIGGLEKGIGSGGINPALRQELQSVEGYIHVVRVFEDDTVPHPEITIDPKRDVVTLDTEFLLSDLITVERRMEKFAEDAKRGLLKNKPQAEVEMALMTRFKDLLEQERPLREMDVSEDELKMIRGYGFLTLKPMQVVFNCGETLRQPPDLVPGYDYRRTALISLQGKIEEEIAQLEGDDQKMFLAEYGISEPSAQRVIKSSYDLMHIQTFFTVGEDECRAWSVAIGATAPEAAGAIHSDLQRGFIRAEVMAYNDLVRAGSEAEMKKLGLMRLEGKEYIVKDGDILNIRHAT